MSRQPETGRVMPDRLADLHSLLLRINFHALAGLGLFGLVLRLQTGQWPLAEGWAFFAMAAAAVLTSIGVGEAAWRHGWRAMSVLVLAAFAIPLFVVGLWLMAAVLAVSAAALGSPEFREFLGVAVRGNLAGWVTLIGLVVGLAFLGRSWRRRGRGTASTACIIVSETLAALMVSVPILQFVVWALSGMK